jgi:isoleucyl-tRNA synthetase
MGEFRPALMLRPATPPCGTLGSETMPPYRSVAEKPDHPALEREILELWDRDSTFERLREQTAGGPTFSFIDGPITANNKMGVHHAWGRSLKDLFQRFKAMDGHELRYQNGFDCQGLWVEVEVEKALGLNSKRDIEAYGLDRFMRACRDRVAEFSAVQAEQSRRLGMWMDWERSYFTMADANIEYIWRFLKTCSENGWLYRGHRPMVWCPRCGTSLSQHELTATDCYRDLTHPSLYVYLPLLDTEHEALVVWTTTPWTLPANVTAAVKADGVYAGVRAGPGTAWVLEERAADVFGPNPHIVRTVPGSELVGRPYRGPFDELPAQEGIEHRVVAWDDVATDEGTGIVHIAPGCGEEDFTLGRELGLPVLVPVDDAGAFYADYGWLHGEHTADVRQQIIEDLGQKGRLLEAGEITHRYPTCWRCGTELIFRVVDEWFISADGVRERMIAANAKVDWTPDFYGKRMEDWLRNMGDWCISRKRYWGLPLPFYLAPSGKVTVIGSREELRERAVDPEVVDGLPELHRPWIDQVQIRTDDGEIADRITEVGDCWLDAGIVPFSTLGWQHDTYQVGGYARGASEGLTLADVPDHAYWEKWFPANWISEMREQIRLWFYSQLFMSVALIDRAPYERVLGYEKLLDEQSRAMHKSWGNAIWFDDAVDQMGADVMRWMYAAQTPGMNLRFGYGPADDVKRRLLTLWNSYRFFVQYAEVDGFTPDYADLSDGPATLTPLDRWIVARAQAAVTESREALDGYWTPAYVRAVEAFIDDLSNWYIRGSRARFWRGPDDADKQAAFRTLWYCLVQITRLIAPAMPFLAEELWQTLVRDQLPDAPVSVHLSGYPEANAALADADLVAAIGSTQTAIRLGRAARSKAGPPVSKLRQPLREAVVAAPESLKRGLEEHAAEIAAELNVKSVRVVEDASEIVHVDLTPNFRAVGKRLGRAVPEVQRLLREGAYTRDGDEVRVGEWVLGPDEYEERVTPREGLTVEHEGAIAVGVETALDDELVDEGIARDLVHLLQSLRRDAGLAITDRVRVRYQANDRGERVVDRHRDWIAGEVLAVELAPGEAGGAHLALDGAEISVAVSRV